MGERSGKNISAGRSSVELSRRNVLTLHLTPIGGKYALRKGVYETIIEMAGLKLHDHCLPKVRKWQELECPINANTRQAASDDGLNDSYKIA